MAGSQIFLVLVLLNFDQLKNNPNRSIFSQNDVGGFCFHRLDACPIVKKVPLNTLTQGIPIF